ncbi:MAG: hypothetical protein K9H16_10000, partial [Bacteroidales bacterium]|nr:hypothetical protein [Bacteroidales bacterium]
HPLDEFKIEIKNYSSHKISDFKDRLKKYANQQIVFGGMVVASSHRMSKDDKPWGIFTIEDFDDTFEMRLFSEDYLKYKNFLTEGFFLLISGVSKQRFRNDEDHEFKISDIKLLPEILERQTRHIKLMVTLSDLQTDLVDEIFEIAQKFPGECFLSFQVYDEEEKLGINLNSTKVKVAPAKFLKAISKVPEVEFQLNKG